jgi:muramidase (phage lysozyme)
MTNINAFLAMIRHSEGTDKAPDPYAVTFGYKFTITDFSDHPAVLGTWKGEPLDFLGSRYAGEVSTAAGAYQIIKPTWITLKRRLSLPDFTAPSQDAAAVGLIREARALDLVNGGQIAAAIDLCHGIWASLPGSTSGQPQVKMAELIQAYTNNGGGFEN